ncbi:MAG: hypothetical protein ACRD2R_04150, partial [Terriglobales bacterium]
ASLSAGNLASPEVRPVISHGGETMRPAAPSLEVTAATLPRVAPTPAAAPPPPAPRPPQEVIWRPPQPPPREAAPPRSAVRRELYWQIRVLRVIVSLVTLVLPLSYFAYFLIDGGIIPLKLVEGTFVVTAIRVLVLPVLGLAKRIIAIHLTFGGLDLLIVVLGVVALFVRYFLVLPLEKLERWAKQR